MEKEQLYEMFSKMNNLHQELNDILGTTETDLDKDSKLKLKIPTGYIRPVYDFRIRLKCVKDKVTQYNIAYQLQLSDFFSWVLNRTNISLSVREMLIKYEIVLLSAIAETLAVVSTSDKDMSFKDRIALLKTMGLISENTQDELNWLWKTRRPIHLYLLNEKEYGNYKDDDFNKAVFAVRNLLDELNYACK